VIGRKNNSELTLEMIKQWVQGVRVKCGHADGMVASTEEIRFRLWNPITFVENERPRNHVEIEVLENLDDGGNLDVNVGGAGVDDMDQQVRLPQFLQRCSKRSDQFLGQIANEANRVRHDDLTVPWESKSAARRIERLKQPVFRGNMTLRQDIQEGGFSGVGIADQGKNRHSVSGSTRTALALMTDKLMQLPLEMRDAVSDAAPICFQFCFTRPPCPDASAEARQFDALSGKSGQ